MCFAAAAVPANHVGAALVPLAPPALAGARLEGLPARLAAGLPLDTLRFAAAGPHWIAPGFLAAEASRDGVMLADGRGLQVAGALVRERAAVPPEAGGLGDTWDDFTWSDVNSSGSWVFCGDTGGVPSSVDDFVCRDGRIWRREGESLGGHVTTGPVRAAALGARGELALSWSVVDAEGHVRQAVFLEEELLASDGDAVDLDGDGQADAGAVIRSFREGSLAVDTAGGVRVRAMVRQGARDTEMLLRFGGGPETCPRPLQ